MIAPVVANQLCRVPRAKLMVSNSSKNTEQVVCDDSASPLQLSVEIVYQSGDWKVIDNAEVAITKAVAVVSRANELSGDGNKLVSVVLANDQQVQQLNLMHRKVNKPTNVLSFPFQAQNIKDDEGEDTIYLGDVVLALETIITESTAAGQVPVDHLQHLVVHGILHLFGYDHQTDLEAQRMETLEIKLFSELNIENPYADAT